MRGYNHVQFIGNLGNTPRIQYSARGTAIATANLAVNSVRRGPDGRNEESTEWLRLVFFDREAETFARFGTKGGSIFVEGRLQTQAVAYEAASGIARSASEVVVSYFQLLSGHAEHEPVPMQSDTARYDSDTDPTLARTHHIVHEHLRANPGSGQRIVQSPPPVFGDPDSFGPLEATVVSKTPRRPRAPRGVR